MKRKKNLAERNRTPLVSQSFIVTFFRNLTDAVYKAFASSMIGSFFTGSDETEALIEDSVTATSVNKSASRFSASNFRYNLSSAVENSGIARLYTAFIRMLLSKSLRVYGVFFMSFGGYGIISYLIKKYAIKTEEDLLKNIIIFGFMLFGGFLLLFSDKKLSEAVKEGKLSGLILFKLFGLREVAVYNEGETDRRAMGAFTLGMVCGLLTLITEPENILLPLVGLIFLFLVLYSPESGLLAAVIGLPFLSTMVLVAIIIAVTVSYFLKLIRGKRNFTLKASGVTALLFLLSLFFSGITSTGGSAGFETMVVSLCFAWGFFLSSNLIRSRNLVRSAFRCFMISGSVVAFIGVIEYLLGYAPKKWLDPVMFSDITGRVVSTFENPNVLGEFLITLLPLFILLPVLSRKVWKKNGSFLLLAVAFACLYFTWSRGAWICAVFSIVLFAMLSSKKSFSAMVWLLLLTPIGVSLISSTEFWHRLTSIGNLADSSTSYRVFIWRAVFNMISDFFGSGIGIGGEAFSKVYIGYSFAGIETAPHSHSLYLQLLVEGGILHLLFFCATVFFVLQECISKASKSANKRARYLVFASACGIVAFLVMGLFDYTFYNFRIQLFFWLFCGFSIAAARNSPQTQVETGVSQQSVYYGSAGRFEELI